ncbi:hypothetical protein CEXT_754511 [Caerostris extrusa]|uniref:Uncharacterized protein n=1 Tax=Caerostris extrusa TaxID=172846 RepID=A0AAV4NSQ7_CAEEX|nr:hypothetical protein CEXT_754511 [Caerostris extrusa]
MSHYQRSFPTIRYWKKQKQQKLEEGSRKKKKKIKPLQRNAIHCGILHLKIRQVPEAAVAARLENESCQFKYPFIFREGGEKRQAMRKGFHFWLRFPKPVINAHFLG